LVFYWLMRGWPLAGRRQPHNNLVAFAIKRSGCVCSDRLRRLFFYSRNWTS
jgi:hypothetical protein